MSNSLQYHIDDHVTACGSTDMSASLGIKKMPEGYALMLNPDKTHYYWLRKCGLESCIHWDKWAVYRGAKQNHIVDANKKVNEEEEL